MTKGNFENILTRQGYYIVLSNGRQLGYSEYGAPDGDPCFYFHGRGGTRLQGVIFSEAAAIHNIRLIAIDRPGMGLSDYLPNRTILSWSDDVIELADALSIGKFSVLGVSAGGIYTVTCAYSIPDRIKSCTIISGLGPIEFGTRGMDRSNKMMLTLARRQPWLLKLMLWLSFGRKSQDEEYLRKRYKQMVKKVPDADKKVLTTKIMEMLFVKDTYEVFRQGTKGQIQELQLYAKPWGFKLKDITSNLQINLWHGNQDTSVPPAMAKKVSQTIPNCKATFFPEEGHMSVFFNHQDKLFELIASQSK